MGLSAKDFTIAPSDCQTAEGSLTLAVFLFLQGGDPYQTKSKDSLICKVISTKSQKR
jgi:hypothetical protein